MISDAEIERGFAEIVRCALAGERAPTNCTMDNPNGTLRAGLTSELVRRRRIRVEVYAKNWRVIEIIQGEHTGRRTKEEPNGRQPYRVIPERGSAAA